MLSEKNTQEFLENDPMEAIFALNLGDFLTEHLISKDLLSKINVSVQDKVIRIKNQLKELVSIYSIDKTLTLLGFNSKDDFVIYNSIAKTIAQMLEVDACHIYLTSEYVKSTENKNDLTLAGCSLAHADKLIAQGFGYSFEDAKHPVVKSYLKQETVSLKNTKTSKNWVANSKLNEDKVKSIIIVPMASNAGKIGTLCLESYKGKEIAKEFIELIEVTARLFVTSMRLQELVERANELIADDNSTPMELTHVRTDLTATIGDLGDEQQMFVEALAHAVDAKGGYCGEHSRYAASVAKSIAEYLKLNEKTSDLIYYAAMLQNIGKITLPEDIFNKKEKLSAKDWEKLEKHPNVGVSLIMKINFMAEIIPYINYQRERWDGSGQPEGLSGISIPFGSRITAVADAYQAMISERPYRKPMPKEKALQIMKEEAGKKWDPMVVDALFAVYSK